MSSSFEAARMSERSLITGTGDRLHGQWFEEVTEVTSAYLRGVESGVVDQVAAGLQYREVIVASEKRPMRLDATWNVDRFASAFVEVDV